MIKKNTAKYIFAALCCLLAAAMPALALLLPKKPLHMLFELIAASLLLFAAGRLISSARPERAQTVMRAAFAGIFALYAALLVYLLFFSGYYERRYPPEAASYGETLRLFAERTVNLRPGVTIRRMLFGAVGNTFRFRNLFGNLAAFAPTALLLPLLWRRMRRFAPYMLFICASIIAAELIQLFSLTGWCDVDDLILNAAGCAMTFLILGIPPLRRLVERLTLLKIR